MDNDAKSCYDRIVASLALIISHHFGVPEELCKTVGETLRLMQFRLRTAMGVSDEHYSHSPDTPIHGVGQGGTASPAFWLLVSSVLFDCFQKKATGMNMSDPTNQIHLHQWLEALVDDTSIFTNMPHSTSIIDLVIALENDTQYWERLLSVSGGCLELTKCFYYILAWSFTPTGDPIPYTPQEIEALSKSIQLQEFGKDTHTKIATKHANEPHKTLGVWKTMTGNDAANTAAIRSRSNNIASIVGTSGMYPHQAEVAIRQIYTPAMGYSLPAVNTPAKTLHKIQYKALESFTPALGYNKGFPRVVILGPTDFGGLGIPHIYTESRIQQLEILITHLRSNTSLGTLFRINLNWLKVLTGLGEPFFESSHNIDYVDNWFVGIRHFLLEIGGHLHIPDTYTPILERQGDQFIMNEILRCNPSLSATQRRYIHNWRLYFQVTTLSDLTNAKGDMILDVYLTKPQNLHINELRTDRKSTINWPHQPPPESIKTFRLWTSCIRKCFLLQYSNKLCKPLGDWIVSPATSRSTWHSYIDSTRKQCLICNDKHHALHSCIISSTNLTTTFANHPVELIDHIPSHFFPVDMVHDTISIKTHHAKINTTWSDPISLPPVTNIQEAIAIAPPWQRHLVQHFRIHDVDTLILKLQDPNIDILSVSDGGMRDGIGSFGVAVGDATSELYCLEGPASGNIDFMTPFRSEAYGMLASFTFLNLFLSSHKISIPPMRKLKVYCDNLTLVTWMQDIAASNTYPRMFLRSESDVILQLIAEIAQLRLHNIHPEVIWVKGHQDDHAPYSDLPRPAQLNVDADSYSTNYLDHGEPTPYFHLPANPVGLYLHYQVITRAMKSTFRIASRSPDLRQYMIKKFQWKDSTPDLIWWQIHGSAIQSFVKSDQRRIRKFIFNWLPTCERLNRYDKDISDQCPSCDDSIESHSHLLKCTCPKRTHIKTEWFGKLELLLKNATYTPTIVGQIFLHHIQELCDPESSQVLPPTPPSIQKVYNSQSQIGWNQIMRGRLAIGWGTIIANHLSKNKVPEKEMSPLIWGRKLVCYTFDLMLSLWVARNNTGHQYNSNNDSILSRKRLVAQISALQESNPDIPYHARDFIYRPIADIEKFSVSNLTAWHNAACSL